MAKDNFGNRYIYDYSVKRWELKQDNEKKAAITEFIAAALTAVAFLGWIALMVMIVFVF